MNDDEDKIKKKHTHFELLLNFGDDLEMAG